MATQLPRGLRNNNPLNIRHNPANQWQGAADEQRDPQFVQFTSMVWGLRAGIVIIRNWLMAAARKNESLTMGRIISKWAPASDGNNVPAYISKVHRLSGIAQHDIVCHSDRSQIVNLVWAMAFVECGRAIDPRHVEEAYNLVFPLSSKPRIA